MGYQNGQITKSSELEEQTWNFIVFESSIILDRYYLKKRATKRHKFVTDKFYDRLRTRESSLEENEVPFTEEIKAEAKQIIIDQLKVCYWSEYKH